jgi:hypothetical protein
VNGDLTMISRMFTSVISKGATYRRKGSHWNFTQLQRIDVSGVMLRNPLFSVSKLERKFALGVLVWVLRTWTLDLLEFGIRSRISFKIRSRIGRRKENSVIEGQERSFVGCCEGLLVTRVSGVDMSSSSGCTRFDGSVAAVGPVCFFTG